jgi:hypothetical protein
MDFIFGLIWLYILYKITTYIYRKIKKYTASNIRAHEKLLEEKRRKATAEIEEKRRKATAEMEALNKLEYQQKLDQAVSTEPLIFGCSGHPNRTLALRYGILNVTDGRENSSIVLLKKGHVEGFEDRGHYYAELCDFENARVRVVIDEGSDYINTFYPLDDKVWFSKYESLEKLLKNSDSFTLKELAKYYIDIVLVPALKSS